MMMTYDLARVLVQDRHRDLARLAPRRSVDGQARRIQRLRWKRNPNQAVLQPAAS